MLKIRFSANHFPNGTKEKSVLFPVHVGSYGMKYDRETDH